MIQTLLELLIEMAWITNATKSKQAIAIGHCTRLTTLTSSELRRIQTRIHKHQLPIHFVGLPTSDLLMMGRPPQAGGGGGGETAAAADDDDDDDSSSTPFSRPRGTLQVVSMIKDWGLDACLGVNNVGNPFTPHGTGDPLQLACWGAGLYHAGTAGDAEILYQCVSGRAARAVGLDAAELGGEGEAAGMGTGVGIQGGLGAVPYPGLLVENSEYDELPGAGAGASILVPSRRRLGVKDVVWDPPTARRIVRYTS
jgi:hypothetical protein